MKRMPELDIYIRKRSWPVMVKFLQCQDRRVVIYLYHNLICNVFFHCCRDLYNFVNSLCNYPAGLSNSLFIMYHLFLQACKDYDPLVELFLISNSISSWPFISQF